MTSNYLSLATANCEFTFEGIPPFTASFTGSASDIDKKKAMKLSKKVVLQTVDKYIKETSSTLLKNDTKITYKVKKHVGKVKKNIDKEKKSCGCAK